MEKWAKNISQNRNHKHMKKMFNLIRNEGIQFKNIIKQYFFDTEFAKMF